jgi:hypothetical protein
MISACAITLTGILSHYAAINDRMRAMARERLGLAGEADIVKEAAMRERLNEIDAQLPKLLRRHKMIRNSVLLIYVAVLIFIADMFVIAAATMAETLAALALAVFLGGMGALLVGVLLMAMEIRISHRAVEYEVLRVLALPLNRSP